MTRIHPTASIDPDARLAEGVEVGAYAVIEGEVSIGEGCVIGPHAVIHRYTSLGRRNLVGPHAVLGGEPQDLSFRPCVSRLEIGDDNVIREAVTIHRGHREGHVTRVGNGNYLMVNAHIAHDCVVGNNTIFANNATLAGHVIVEDRAFLSGNVAIHQYCRVGRLAMVAGLAKVVQDCLPFMITDGNPARARGLNVVGLRRAGVSREDIAALKNAYRLLLSRASQKDVLATLSASRSELVRELAAFIGASRRGYAHARRGPAPAVE